MASGKRKTTKKKPAAAKAPATPANAELTRLRGRLQYEVDHAVQRALRAEIAKLEKGAKDANLAFKTADGKMLRPPERVYQACRVGYRGGKKVGAELLVRELVSIKRSGETDYGKPALVVTGRAPGSPGAQQLTHGSYQPDWWSTKALAIKDALKDADEDVKREREELEDAEAERAAIAALADAPERPATTAKKAGGGTKYHEPATQKAVKSWAPFEDQYLRELVDEGKSLSEAAEKLSRSMESVRKRAGRLQLKFSASINGKAPAPVEDAPPPKVDDEAASRIAGAAADEAEPLEENAIFRSREYPGQRVQVRDSAGGQVLYVALDVDGQPTKDVDLMVEEEFRAAYEAIAEPVAS